MTISIKTAISGIVVSVCCFLAFAYYFTQLFPIFDNIEIARHDIDRAKAYYQLEHCQNGDKLSAVEGWNKCKESKIMMNKSPYALGIYMTMSDAQLCSNGVCEFAGFNLTNVIARLLFLVAGIATLLLCCCSAKIVKVRSDIDE